MNILTVIPARGGSKRLPGKNVRLLGGKPLIAWTIDSARASGCAGTVIVSTDDELIAEAATTHGAEVPWLRPAHLATDAASSVEVALHAVQWCERERHPVDGLLLLQPTSPFRGADVIRDAIDRFQSVRCDAIVSVSPLGVPSGWCYRVVDGKLSPLEASPEAQSQCEPIWVLNGALYLVRPEVLVDKGSFVPVGTVALPLQNAAEAIDIDDEDDWQRAESMLPAEAASDAK